MYIFSIYIFVDKKKQCYKIRKSSLNFVVWSFFINNKFE